jgi:Ni,Fe-hydrogenase I cytochrome b subunit
VFALNTYVDYLSLIPAFILWVIMIIFIKSKLYMIKIEKIKKNSMKVSAIVDEIIPGKAKYSKLY